MIELWGNVYPVFLTLLMLGMLILLHELGHFLICRKVGIRVEKFSVGFGREIWVYQGKETRYAISLFPLGGFVRPAGEEMGQLEGKRPKKGDYLAASVRKRMAVVSAGPIMNWLLAWVLFFVILLLGRPLLTPTIGSFMEGYPAETSGLVIGDRVVLVQGEPVTLWTDMTDLIQKHGVADLELTVLRGVEEFTITVLPRDVEDERAEGKRLTRIGIKPDMSAVILEKLSANKAFLEASLLVYDFSRLTLRALGELVTGRLSLDAVSGPVGVISLAGEASKLGIVYIFQLAAMLSVSLAVFNMLPIPALDGGHFLFLLFEAVRGKPVSLKIQERSTQVCFLLLIGLIVVVTVNDFARLSWVNRIGEWFTGNYP